MRIIEIIKKIIAKSRSTQRNKSEIEISHNSKNHIKKLVKAEQNSDKLQVERDEAMITDLESGTKQGQVERDKARIYRRTSSSDE